MQDMFTLYMLSRGQSEDPWCLFLCKGHIKDIINSIANKLHVMGICYREMWAHHSAWRLRIPCADRSPWNRKASDITKQQAC